MTSEAFSKCLESELGEDTCKLVLLREVVRAEADASNIYEPIIDYFEENDFDRGAEVVRLTIG